MNNQEVELDQLDDSDINIKLYTITDIQRIFHIGKNKAYKLIQLRGFPTMQIGKTILVPHDQLYQWINNNVFNKIDV